jgi:hypothetical protein
MIGGIELKKLPILLNWLTKALIITIVPFFIGLIDNATIWKNSNGQIKNIFISGKFWVISLTILYIIYIIYVAYNERKQEKNNQTLEDLKKQKQLCDCSLEIYKTTFDSINNLMNISQKEINDLSKQIISTNNLELLNWNFESISSYICKDIVSILRKLSKSGTDISVNIYVRHKRNTGKRTQDCIKMIAHYGDANSTPTILYSDIILSKKKDWQYAKLFLENNPKIVVYPTEEEIKKNFGYNGTPSKYDGEYSQYIGIPISCSAGYILSSLEIIAHHGTIIADTKTEILEIVNKYIIVYRNYALLTHKIEKGLKAKRVENIFKEAK